MPLTDRKIIAFVMVSDAERALSFYQNVLGLRFVSQDSFALVFDAGGIMLRAGLAHCEIKPAPHTVLGWEFPDIVASIDGLAGAGVQFNRYPGMPQDERGIWITPDGSKVAWFKDPDGNVLSLTQFAEAS